MGRILSVRSLVELAVTIGFFVEPQKCQKVKNNQNRLKSTLLDDTTAFPTCTTPQTLASSCNKMLQIATKDRSGDFLQSFF